MILKIKHKTRLNKVELELTTNCNLKCFACNRLCGAAPSKEEMSIEQIEKFLKESESYKWKSIALMGGEPFIHTQIDKVLDMFSAYAHNHPETDIKIITNGIVKKDIPEGLRVHKSVKKKRFVPDFGNVFLAPVDRIKGAINTCKITSTCGMGLTRYGYFPCGCGAAVARVAGLDIGIKNLCDVKWDAVEKQLKRLCHLCGRNLEYKILCKKNSGMSPYWKKSIREYNKQKPSMTLY